MRVAGETTAWQAIGFEGSPYDVETLRIKGGRTLYEDAIYRDGGGTDKVKLGRLTADLHSIIRYVDPDTVLEVMIPEETR